MVGSYKYNNHAAALIIKDSSWPCEFCCSYIFQRKSKRYPVKKFVGLLSFFGGNWTEIGDKNPLDTIVREIKEELSEVNNLPFLEELVKNIKSFGEYEIFVPSQITNKGDMLFTASVFSSELTKSYDLKTNEGGIVQLPICVLDRKMVAWGYGEVFNDYLKKKLVRSHKEITVKRLNMDCDLDYTLRGMDNYRINPLREKSGSEEEVFNLKKK